MKVRVVGPNLRDDSKGTFHVHADGCKDLTKYGPGRRLGGDCKGEEEMLLDVDTAVEVVEATYADQLSENPDVVASDWLYDFHFAPCVKGLPRGESEQVPSDEDIDHTKRSAQKVGMALSYRANGSLVVIAKGVDGRKLYPIIAAAMDVIVDKEGGS